MVLVCLCVYMSKCVYYTLHLSYLSVCIHTSCITVIQTNFHTKQHCVRDLKKHGLHPVSTCKGMIKHFGNIPFLSKSMIHKHEYAFIVILAFCVLGTELETE